MRSLNVRFGRPFPPFCSKMFGGGGAPGLPSPVTGLHRLHVRRGVLLHDDVDRRRELDVAAHVIAVRVRVDDGRDRLRAQLLDLRQNRRAPSRVLRVDDGDAVRLDEDGRVAAAASPFRTNRLSLSFSTSTTMGFCPPCCATTYETAPAAIRAVSTTMRFIPCLQRRRPVARTRTRRRASR